MPQTEKEWRKFRQKVNGLVNRANSMLEKLEKNNLENTPSYNTFTTSEGRTRFGIKGMTNEEVNAEFQKVKAFLDNTTSTVKGAKQYVKTASKVMGISTANFNAIYPNFWAIAGELRKSLELTKARYLALDSERVINTVRQVIEKGYQGTEQIENIADALESAVQELERDLPNAVTKDVADYMQEYIDMIAKDNTINLTINF